jgi:perosamine synthetase
MNHLDVEQVLSALRQVLPKDRDFIPLHEPVFEQSSHDYVAECISTGWVSSVGAFVDRFERDLATFTGAKRAIAIVNGTSALHVALQLVGVQPGDEVIIPSFTFVATANAVSYCGATPHFVDSEEATLGLDPRKLEAWLQEIAIPANDHSGCINRLTGRRIAAIVPMHTFGHPVDLDRLLEVAQRWEIEVVEDAAESLGSIYNGKHTGRFGRLGVLSFNGNKIITTGGGGAIITDDDDLANRAKHITTTAKTPHRWEFNHDLIGYNYRMPNLNAALGCAQLEMLSGYIEKKRQLAQKYRNALKGVRGVRLIDEPKGAFSNYWLNALLLDIGNEGVRDSLLELTNDNGIMTRPAWTLLHKLPMYSNSPRMFSLEISESLERRIVNIPSSANL